MTCSLRRSPSCAQPDMAVVISQSQNEIAEMAAHGIDIKPYRKRIVEENLENKFKDPLDHLRLVFRLLDVDHPGSMSPRSPPFLPRQAAAQPHADADDHARQPGIPRKEQRADRRIRRRVPQPSRRRSRSTRPAATADEVPIEEKGALVDALKSAIDDLRSFCSSREVDLDQLAKLKGFEMVAAGKQTIENADGRRRRAGRIPRTRRARQPALQGDPARHPRQRVQPAARRRHVPRGRDRRVHRAPDVSGVMGRVEQLLDDSVAANEYLIPASDVKLIVRPRDRRLGRSRSGLQARTAAHAPRNGSGRFSPRVSARSSGSTPCASTSSSGSSSWSPTTTPAASTPRLSSRAPGVQAGSDGGGGPSALRGTRRGAARDLRPVDAARSRAIRG